jgi:hypothetical protein
VIDLFAGRMGWSKGFLANGYRAVCFDLERPTCEIPEGVDYVLQDVLTLDGQQFKDAACIVASPPCQQYSLWGMRMFHPNPPVPDKRLWMAAIRIAAEAGVPLILENVRGAQYWWGKSAWREGPYYLWFYDCPPLPALVPYIPLKRKNVVDDIKNGDRRGLRTNSRFSSTSAERKQLTAEAAEIPFALADYIARVFNPAPPEAAK